MFSRFYDGKITTETQSVSNGVSLGLGAVASTLGIGGVVGNIAQGITLGSSSGKSVSTTTISPRIIAIPPHAKYGLTEGLQMFAGGTAKYFATGEWRTNTPVFLKDKCRQCLLCAPVCPDVSIPVKDGKRLDFDYDHCKGCGICASVCPFGAIEMKEGIEP